MVELFERLYLSKDSKDNKQDIYVDKCPLVQHQLDGIRFLYRALKKKKQAAILNDPSGYGKRVQSALFLSAILPTLSKPVLILCREGREQHWVSCFQQWTKVYEDIAIELSNPFTKRKVLISAPYCAAAFARRQWSVLVVDDDPISKDIQKSSLTADLRIWITSSNIKEDLAKFFTFHSWVFPKEKFVADKYKANKRDLRDVLTKTAMLDAFLEDIVLRRNCNVVPFTKSQVSTSNNITETRTTKKNKDATGTKIKRSKRRSADTDKPIKVARTTTKNTIETNTEVFEIGVLEDQTKAKNTKENSTKDHEMGDITQSDEENLTSFSRYKGKKRNILWDSDGSEDGQVDATYLQKDENKDHNNTVSQLDESGNQLNALRWDSDTDSENGRKDSRLNVNGGQTSTKTKLANEESPTKNKTNVEKVNNVTDYDLENSGSLLANDEKPIEPHTNEIDNKIIDKINPIAKYANNFSEDLFSTTEPNEINVKQIIYEPESTADKLHTTPNNQKDNELSTKTIKQNELIEKTDMKPENTNLSSFELKMKQLEELAFKKYKGSFLDSIL